MATEEGLFGKYKQCEFCNRPLPNDYEGTLCPRCKDHKLFHDVKEFIRANQVNEYEVADHFKIPLKQVKEWIREGRIEYNTSTSSNTISGMHCQHCFYIWNCHSDLFPVYFSKCSLFIHKRCNCYFTRFFLYAFLCI